MVMISKWAKIRKMMGSLIKISRMSREILTNNKIRLKDNNSKKVKKVTNKIQTAMHLPCSKKKTKNQ